MYFFQERLLFPGTRLVPDLRGEADRIERVAFSPEPGVQLHGVLVRARSADPAARRPLVIYFGGNGEEVTWWAQAREWPSDWAVLLVNYRGYGTSTGRPSERGLYADARYLYDAMRARPDIDSDRIVLFGRSLGSGVATHLATERAVAALLLATPYDSITALARTHFRWLPIGWLLKHRFDSIACAARLRVPMLMLVTPADDVVPLQHSDRLYAAWAGPKSLARIVESDHVEIAGAPEYWRAITQFLATVSAADRPAPNALKRRESHAIPQM